MKKLLSYVLALMMIASLFAITSVSAEGTTVGTDNVVFSMDFDAHNPAPIMTDGNVSVVGGDDGNAAKVAWNGVEYGGAIYSTGDFALTPNSVLKFDILNNGAGFNSSIHLYDREGKNIRVRFRNTSASEYVPSGNWYTYIIQPTETANTYVAYRKAKDSTVWESTAAVHYTAVSANTPATNERKNMFRFACASSSSSNSVGSWWLDNVVVYESTPGKNVIVPENPGQKETVYDVNDDLNGDSCVWTPATSLDFAEMVTDPQNSENKIFEVDGAKATKADKRGALSSITSANHILPFREQGYTLSFDFRKLEDGMSDDQIWLKTGKYLRTTEDKKVVQEAVTSKIYLSQFQTGEWYTVTINITGDSTTIKSSATKTNLSTGETSKLTASIGADGWTSATNNFTITSYNKNQRSTAADWTYSEENPVSPWKGFHWQMDNMKLSYEYNNPIKTEIFTTADAGAIKPMIVAYDSLGIVSSIVEGDATDFENIADFGSYVRTDFDVVPESEGFKNAKTVKILYWDNYNNAKAYASADDISSTLAGNTASTLTAKEIDVTSDMIPADATGNYTLAAYTVPFTASEGSVPAYDANSHKLLAVQQTDVAPEKFVIDSSLYNGETEDIAIVCNAEGATAPVVTLYEENDAPAFKNISMLLGKDITERNFTWYSLNNGAGKITYQKVADMIDGDFSEGAAVADATRCHADDAYSSKEYYYQNQAVITGLEPGETYMYQLSNGTAKSKMYTITIGESKTSFSFLFGGDAQLGGNDTASGELEKVYWEKTLNQMLNAPEFEGADFFLSAGDQIESASTVKVVEDQYDIFLENDTFTNFPMAVTTGNHDAKSAGLHMQHFNEPNKIINPETGNYYGASGGSTIDGVDYYYVYNSVLFMHINLNTFDDNTSNIRKLTGDAFTQQWNLNREDDMADAEEHAAFINAVLEETKDNKDILWKVVYCHQSPFGGSYHNEYKLYSNGNFNRDEQYDYINIRELLLPHFYEAGVDLILSGHDHVYTRTHVIKPNENDDVIGDELNSVVITPYTDGNYTYADGTTTPTYDNGSDGNGWKDLRGRLFKNLKVKSKPVKVTDPDGFVWITGSSSSGSQVNSAEHPNHYAAVCERINQRSLSRIDVTAKTLKIVTYNLGTNAIENNPLVVVDEFEIERTADVPVAGVSLEESAEIAVGTTKTLKAVLTPVEPTNANVSWSSDNEAVATVDENGVVTANSIGTANITVTTADGGFTAVCAVNVIQGVPVTGITIPETTTMEALTTKTIVATVAPEDATAKKLNWTSSDEAVATVDQNGNVTAYRNGEVTITATAKDGSGVSASCVVTITYVPLSKFEISSSSMELDVMEEATLSYSFAPANATFKDVTWSSSAPDVVSVDQTGKIEALKVGTAVISATNAIGEKVECTVVANGGVNFFEDFEDDQLNFTGITGTNVWVPATDEDGNKVYKFDGKNLTSFSNLEARMESGDYNAPMADSGYTIAFDYKKTAEGGYTALEFKTYSHDGVFGGVRFALKDLEVGEWYNVKLVYDGINWTKYYKKASETAYTVQKNSLTYGPSNHTSNIYYDRIWISPWIAHSSNDMNNGTDNSTAARIANAQKTAFLIDNIKVSTDVAATGMTLAETSVALEIGETAEITPVFAPANATDANVTYTTSDANIATVNRFGKVTAISEGTATITATSADGGYTAVYEVLVKGFFYDAPEMTFLGAQQKDGAYSAAFGINAETLLSDVSNLFMAIGEKVYATALFGEGSIINWGNGYTYTDGENKLMFAIQIDGIGADYITDENGTLVPGFKLYLK